MSLGLLSADYASSSSSSSDEEENEKSGPNLSQEPKLSNPFAPSSSSSQISTASSVFTNPFLESERKKESLLQKHVTLTSRQEDQRTLHGRKVCWNFRKGRCRFGHTCSFAHDSDVQLRKTEGIAAVSSETKGEDVRVMIDGGGDGKEEKRSNKRSSRPGLSDSLIPSKKSKKLHQKLYQ
eukprot:TRINITY_DN2819_c0_g1_i1.p1 TRINITY_DN2819_c0_g1~~TRINITY_DN2819_c0_g1_i1.p1  ORF type:complete len:180 (-),score=61.79 TRINITY_DN2819_c0_g1_i1:501-1040(-)